MSHQRHKIKAGDWIIRDPADPAPTDPFEGISMTGRSHADLSDYILFTGHAIFVIEPTETHLTIFDPCMGRPAIIVFTRYPGAWCYATENQVAVTWTLAQLTRRDSAMQIDLERKNFPYKPIGNRKENS